MTPLRATRPVLLLLGAAAVIALAAIVGLGALAWGSGRSSSGEWIGWRP